LPGQAEMSLVSASEHLDIFESSSTPRLDTFVMAIVAARWRPSTNHKYKSLACGYKRESEPPSNIAIHDE